MEAKHRRLDGPALALRLKVEVRNLFGAEHDLGRSIHIGLSIGLTNEGNGPRCTRIGLNDVHDVVLNGKLNVDQAHGAQGPRNGVGMVNNLLHDQVSKVERRQRGIGISRMHSAGLDVLHDSDNVEVFSVAYGIGLGLNCSVEVVVEHYAVARKILKKLHDMGL